MKHACAEHGNNPREDCRYCQDINRRLGAARTEDHEAARLVPRQAYESLMRDNAYLTDRLKEETGEKWRLRKKLENLPADWTEDSSLETWFPFTAKELKELRAAKAPNDLSSASAGTGGLSNAD